MTLKKIVCHFDCAACGNGFQVEMDPAMRATEGWSPFEFAMDAVRGGGGLISESTSVQGTDNDKPLCGRCTRACDALVEEDRPANDDEIAQVGEDATW